MAKERDQGCQEGLQRQGFLCSKVPAKALRDKSFDLRPYRRPRDMKSSCSFHAQGQQDNSGPGMVLLSPSRHLDYTSRHPSSQRLE